MKGTLFHETARPSPSSRLGSGGLGAASDRSAVFAPPREPRESADRPPEAPSVVRRVQRVVDGDTFLLDDGTRVRLQGVDAPESVKPDHPVEPFGREASRFAKRFLAPGVVRLEFDGELYDRHGRLLAYVWCGDRMLNEELLREGLARSEPWFRFSAEKKNRVLPERRTKPGRPAEGSGRHGRDGAGLDHRPRTCCTRFEPTPFAGGSENL